MTFEYAIESNYTTTDCTTKRSFIHNRPARQLRVSQFKMNMQKSIRRLRKSKKLTQRQLGNILGVDQATISNFESGKTIMTLDLAYELILVFGCDFYVECDLSGIMSLPKAS
ncbi:helix-turn-helix transcriptional regulator [Pseudoalteromonas luteoviolacea]|uniref:helix-turn-helix transcriptional regulator n=1 Tax=Pseudoalteromonas luteoviolacea TaxID=43657 RepID=UPI0009B8C8F9|nr:helix-turn-helix transcriptional regulator [Pseudoalteromonas luteoviolacea]